MILDYAADGTQATAYTAPEVATLREGPGGSKIVLGYMSIGDLEDYRLGRPHLGYRRRGSHLPPLGLTATERMASSARMWTPTSSAPSLA